MFPAGADPVVGGAVGRGKAVEAGGNMRAEEDVLKPRRRGIGENATEAFIESCADLTEHNMIQREIAFGIDRPILVEGGRAILDPPAPGRFGFAGRELVSQFAVTNWAFLRCLAADTYH